jgi:hypothetical protein
MSLDDSAELLGLIEVLLKLWHFTKVYLLCIIKASRVHTHKVKKATAT